MTKEEWIARAATRYQSQAGLTPDDARAAAEAIFAAESEELGFEDYSPEDCADNDMSYWTDDGV
jgi:hypothetical protein